jgi:hypothetical protein
MPGTDILRHDATVAKYLLLTWIERQPEYRFARPALPGRVKHSGASSARAVDHIAKCKSFRRRR